MANTFKIGETAVTSYTDFVAGIRTEARAIYRAKPDKINVLKTKEEAVKGPGDPNEILNKKKELIEYQKEHFKLSDLFINDCKIVGVIQANGNIVIIEINRVDYSLRGYNYANNFNPFGRGDFGLTPPESKEQSHDKDNFIFATAEAARFVEAEKLVNWYLQGKSGKSPRIWQFAKGIDNNNIQESGTNVFWKEWSLFSSELKGVANSTLGIDIREFFVSLIGENKKKELKTPGKLYEIKSIDEGIKLNGRSITRVFYQYEKKAHQVILAQKPNE